MFRSNLHFVFHIEIFRHHHGNDVTRVEQICEEDWKCYKYEKSTYG